MVKLEEIIRFIDSKFKTSTFDNYKEESGITYNAGRSIKKIGYATNLTPEVIRLGRDQKVDLIMTHHDAWKFIYGLKDECKRLLNENGISHYYNHLPLDDCEFGTNSSLALELGLDEVKKTCDEDGYKCGVIGEYKEEKDIEGFIDLVESKLEEKVQFWKFNNKPIKRVFILCGAGHLTSDMKEAVDEKCDLYLTGEKILYTVEYAKLHQMNLVVGSHTFIELFGVKSMANIVNDEFKDVEVVLLKEQHLEANGYE
ncbi:Nif3-like dinuclear metal center hexameric protein [Vallitalea okinawensis]|uniref:Nif3-like dinuclear metal center hexameric protein n=1 Tax=Vallitalea okinawensis TaxID=2078660 RepID=UPI000CFAF872|nr:Nif3-like dinuclear metal center hexameric protein [Vallitalea okinawensis]